MKPGTEYGATCAGAVLMVHLATGGVADRDHRTEPRVMRPAAIANTLVSPMRIAFDQNGRLLVSDHHTQKIVTLDPRSLATIGSFDVAGKPLGLAVAGDYVYVGNETTRRVEIYDSAGNRTGQIGGPNGEITQPTDIAIDEDLGRLFVVDGQAKIVKVFAIADEAADPLLMTIPTTGPDPSVLTHPTGIALDTAAREVVVSDFGDSMQGIRARIRIFDYEGSVTGTISGKAGVIGNRFSRPQGLALDPQGHVFMAESFIGQVMAFDRAGAQVKSLGSYGSAQGQLSLPLDLVIDERTLDVYVTDNQNSRVVLFAKGGQVP